MNRQTASAQIASRDSRTDVLLRGKVAQHETSALRKSRASGLSRFSHDFSQIQVSPAPTETLQPKLLIGQPGDRFEQEADRIAHRIMGSADSANAGVDPQRATPASSSVQRSSEDASEESGPNESKKDATEAEGKAEDVAALLLGEDDNAEEGPADEGTAKPSATDEGGGDAMQTRELPGQTPVVSSRHESQINSLRGGGAPLSASSRAFFEPRFGHSFDHVRIHTGPEAARLTHAVRAKAFTVGRDIVFGEGYYAPESSAGRWLMAHELTHVLQQQRRLSKVSAGAISVEQTGSHRVQGGFFGDLWSGIKKGASAVWGGITGAAKKTWQGTKWVADKVWKGLKAVGKWSWNVLKSGAALAWSQIVNAPARVWRLIKHLGSGIAGVASWLWEGLKLAWHGDFKKLGAWLRDGILSAAAWVGRLLGKLIDLVGVGEVWDLLFQIIKFNTRALTDDEKSEAPKTFQNTISYWQVRLDQASLIAAIGALFEGSKGMAVTTFHTINLNQKIHATPGSGDMHWLTHELTHVSQYEHVGSQYLGEALHAQKTKAGYNYKPTELWRPDGSASPNPSGKHFGQFNREQQADIAADYYFSLYNNPVTHQDGFAFTPVTAEYEPVIEELRKGNM